MVCILARLASTGRPDLKGTRMRTHLPIASSPLEEWCVLRRADGNSRRRAWNLVVVATSLFLLVASGCSKQDPYTPPDLFYYFASYKVGKNPTTVTPVDVNQDGFTDLLTTNIGSNTLSILLGNGDGTFREQVWSWPVPGATKLPYFLVGQTENLKKGRAILCIGHPLPSQATI